MGRQKTLGSTNRSVATIEILKSWKHTVSQLFTVAIGAFSCGEARKTLRMFPASRFCFWKRPMLKTSLLNMPKSRRIGKLSPVL